MLIDLVDIVNGFEIVNDCIGFEFVVVLEFVFVENGYFQLELEVEKIGDVLFILEVEKVNVFDGDVLLEFGIVEVGVLEVSIDVLNDS